MWQPATERLQHFQTMLKTKLNVLTLRKEPLPTVIFTEPENIELCSTTTALTKTPKVHAGYKVTYLGKVAISGTQFLSGCTESAVVGLWDRRALQTPGDHVLTPGNHLSTPSDLTSTLGDHLSTPGDHVSTPGDHLAANALLEIRPFQVRLHRLDGHGEASSLAMDTYQVARIAYCTADHHVSPNVFAWIYRQINDDLSFQMDVHAAVCQSKLEAKTLAHSMMEAFRQTFHSMQRSHGRLPHAGSAHDSAPDDATPDDG